ncbi:MAG: hypothetical protein OXF27_17500 [Acidobacteria bacterium]|nr:hypothetical protein [Acidobacteriota bacterium]
MTMRTGAPWVAGFGVALLAGCAAQDPPETAPWTVTVLAQGSPLHATNGMYFGPDGRLYVVSASSATVAAVDKESGEVLERWGPELGVRGPDDITFGADGSAYWTEFSFGDVARRTPDGTISVIASPGRGVNPITFSDDGRLFVSRCALGHELFEIDPEGGGEPRLITDQLGPGCGLNGMDWGPDGRLYGPRPAGREAVRVDVDRGSFETVAADFRAPVALKFDSQHRLHVLDSGTGEVFRVDIETGDKELVGQTAPSADNLAFDADDRLFVSSYAHSFILEVLGPEENRTVMAGGPSFPGGLAWLPGSGGAGRLFLADRRALRELDPRTGEELHNVVGNNTDVGEAMSAYPYGGQLLLGGATTVSIWDPVGDRLVQRFEGFEETSDVLALGDDIIVSEYETGSVLRFNPAAPDDRAVLASGLDEPAGLAAHGDDLYVADRSGSLLQVLNDGERLDPPRVVADGLAGPEGIAAGEDGALYVVEQEAGRVTQVDPETGAATPIAEGLRLDSLEQKSIGVTTAVGFLSDVTVGDGSLYVSSYAENRVYRIDR